MTKRGRDDENAHKRSDKGRTVSFVLMPIEKNSDPLVQSHLLNSSYVSCMYDFPFVVQGLDEIQSYLLLRQWKRFHAVGAASSNGHPALPRAPMEGGQINSTELREVASIYFQERFFLLQSLETLLWIGEDVIEEHPVVDIIEDTLRTLLSNEPDVEEITVQCLTENLKKSLSTGTSSGGGGLLHADSEASNTKIAAVKDLEEQAASSERNVLLTILELLYFHPRKQCTPDRFLELARLFNTYLFIPPPQDDPNNDVFFPTRTSVKLGSLLLLEVLALDMEKVIESFAQGKNHVSHEICPLLDDAVREKVNQELASWSSNPRPIHAPIRLTWAAILHLGGYQAFEQHTSNASDALSALASISENYDVKHMAAEMRASIVRCALSAILTAFRLDPLKLPFKETEALVDTIVHIFENQPALCESFWLDTIPLFEPLHRFIEDLSGLFPAFSKPVLRVLRALSSSKDSAAGSFIFFARMSSLMCLHTLPDHSSIIVHESNEVTAANLVPLPGASILTIPPGAIGDLVAPAPGMMTGRKGFGTHLIRWKVPLALGKSHLILLCNSFESLHEAQRLATAVGVLDAQITAKDHLENVSSALAFFESLCRDRASSLQLLQVRVPTDEHEEDHQQWDSRIPDVLLLASQVLRSIPNLVRVEPQVLVHAAAHALHLMQVFASPAPGRVISELRNALGLDSLISNSKVLEKHRLLIDARLESDMEPLQALLSAERSFGTYPSTHAFMELMQTLLQSSPEAVPSLLQCLNHIADRVVPRVVQWKFANESDRWHVAGACVDVFASLIRSLDQNHPPPSSKSHHLGNQKTQDISSKQGTWTVSLEAKKRFDVVGRIRELFWLLPPSASVLNEMAQQRHFEKEMEAAEKCAKAWLRLVPLVLPSDASDAISREIGIAFFRADGGRTSSAASILLSFFNHPYFMRKDLALLVRAMHCFEVAATSCMPDLPFLTLLPSETETSARRAIIEKSSTLSRSKSSSGAIACLQQALSLSVFKHSPELFGAACDVIVAAVNGHPSLLDSLLFPSPLESTIDGRRDDGSKEPAERCEVPKGTSDAEVQKATEDSTVSRAHTKTCLDALWDLLRDVERLKRDYPYALAKTMHVLSAVWQAGGPSYRALQALRRQNGFWKALVDVVRCETNIQTALADLAHTALEKRENQQRLLDECWRITSEASALDILSAELFVWTRTASISSARNPTDHTPDLIESNVHLGSEALLPKDLAQLLREGMADGTLVAKLLARYSDVMLPTVMALGNVRDTSVALGLQTLALAIYDPVLWNSLEVPPSILQELALSLQPELQRQGCSSLQDAFKMLVESSQRLIPNHSTERRHAMTLSSDAWSWFTPVAEKIQALAIPADKLRSAQEYGRDYIFDRRLLSQRLFNNAFGLGYRALSLLQEFPTEEYREIDAAAMPRKDMVSEKMNDQLEATNIICSLEEARLNASLALDTCVAVSQGAWRALTASRSLEIDIKTSTSAELNVAPSIATVEAVWKVLSNSIDSLIHEAQGICHELSSTERVQEAYLAASTMVLDVVRLHLASISSVSRVALALLRSECSNYNRLYSRNHASAVEDDEWMMRSLLNQCLELCISFLEGYGNIMQCCVLLHPHMDTYIDATDEVEVDAWEDARGHASSTLRCIVAASLQVVFCVPSIGVMQPASGIQITDTKTTTKELYPYHRHASLGQSLVPLLMDAVASDPSSTISIPAISLITALMERILPPDMSLSLLRKGPRLGRLLATSLNGGPTLAPMPTESVRKVSNVRLGREARSAARVHLEEDTQDANFGSRASSTMQEALLLLMMQAAQIPGGASLLVQHGVPQVLAALASWLMAPLPSGGDLMRERPGASSDYGNAYDQDGRENPVHKTWLALLAFLGALVVSLPGHPAIEDCILQIVTVADPRLMLAITPPKGDAEQPMTLAMAQEARYALFLLSAVASRISGRWIMQLPHAISSVRRYSAALLRFVANPGHELVFVACSQIEKQMLRNTRPSIGLTDECLIMCAMIAKEHGLDRSVVEWERDESDLYWKVADNLYASVACALNFQIATAPEISEEETLDLGPEWVDKETLNALISQAIQALPKLNQGLLKLKSMREASDVQKLIRTFVSILKFSCELLELVNPSERAVMRDAVALALEDAERVSSWKDLLVGKRG